MPAEQTRYRRAAGARRAWREAFDAYLHRRVVGMFFLGFSAGLPLLLVFSTLSAWLRDAEVTRTTIGFFSWVGITYSIKVFWAPIVDRVAVPLLNRWLGRRRSWMLLAQIGIALGILGMATSDPQVDLFTVAIFALVVAFSSATQDIAIDAYRIEALDPEYQGAMSAMYVSGYRVAMLVAGAGALFIADLGPFGEDVYDFTYWTYSYGAMAALMSVGMITVLVIAEPEARRLPETLADEERAMALLEKRANLPPCLHPILAWTYGAVICPFRDFFERNGWFLALTILVFVGAFKLSDITLGVMANPFYLDLGFTKSEIASIAKVYGFVMTLGGTFLGGLLALRYGIMRTLLLGAVLAAVTNLTFAYMAATGKSTVMLAVVIGLDNLAGGLATAAFIAYLSSLTNVAYTATQYALFSSFMTLPGKFLAGFSGVVVDSAGYVTFFLYTTAMGIPAIILVLYLMRPGLTSVAGTGMAVDVSDPGARRPSP
ncbi:MAG: AmpG family muropeptide MFS transporter [Kiloniellaceae bacterium]